MSCIIITVITLSNKSLLLWSCGSILLSAHHVASATTTFWIMQLYLMYKRIIKNYFGSVEKTEEARIRKKEPILASIGVIRGLRTQLEAKTLDMR